MFKQGSEKGERKNPQENLRLYMHKINQPITSTDGKEIEDVKSFTFNKQGTQMKIGLARTTFNILTPTWNSNYILKRTEFRLFNSNILYMSFCTGVKPGKRTKMIIEHS